MKNIYKIAFKSDTNNLKEYKPKSSDEVFFQILIGQKFYDFCMYSKQQLLIVIKGLLSILKKIRCDEYLGIHLIQISNKYDSIITF